MAQRTVTAHVYQVQCVPPMHAPHAPAGSMKVLRAYLNISPEGQPEGELVVGGLQFDFDAATGCPWRCDEHIELTISDGP